MVFAKTWKGWAIMHTRNKRESPTSIYRDENGKIAGLSGYIYVYVSKKGAVDDCKEISKESKDWLPSETFRVAKVLVREI